MRKLGILFVLVLVFSMNLLASNDLDVKKFDAVNVSKRNELCNKYKVISIEIVKKNVIRIDNKDYLIIASSEYLQKDSKAQLKKVVYYGLDSKKIKQIRITSEYVILNENEVYKR